MPGYPGRVWRGSQVPSPPPTVLGEFEDGGNGEGVIQCTLLQRERCDPGRTTVSHHFQCGGRRGGLPLGIPAGGGTGVRRE